ncbi:MAG: hypothetical protein Ct9H90mP11_06110 [Acidimicrobiales bacterium]|nr:MAG: hypothetical protein Ct9H90mP11_06110 [Acidimicrobiales bacterium]
MKKGETVPDFEAINQEGASVSLSSMLEKWSSCPFFLPKSNDTRLHSGKLPLS